MPGPKFLLALLFAGFLVAACGNKSNLNIPENPPPGALQPDLSAEAFVRMGQKVEAAGDFNSAGGFYGDALRLDSTLIDAHLGLARVYGQLGDPRRSALAYGNAWSLAPENTDILRRYLQGLLPNDGEVLALRAIDTYLASYKPTPEILNFKGVAHDLNGEPGAAEEAYRQGLALAQPGSAITTTLLGNLALSLGLKGETSEAVLLLNPFIGDMSQGRAGLTQAQSGLRQNLALVYALSGNIDSAVEVAKTALSLADAEYNRGFYEAIAGLQGRARAKAVFMGELPENLGP